jgi:hypothetical protein
MAISSAALWLLAQEARALLTRLARVKPFALHETMVPAAISPIAQAAIGFYLARGRLELRALVHAYLKWLHSPAGRRATPAEALTQRSEHDTGVWLSGLDTVAADALALPDYYQAPPVICYLDRGVGAAIRRARTRLPGGGKSPVAVIRVPRERMIGSGIASSLVHEVGHQAAALLNLVNSLRPVLQERRLQASAKGQNVWPFWERWIGEIVADFWSVARVGVASTLGLIHVVSLPRAFVFRVGLDDPHPIPWIRVKLSCALGQALYPHPQWERLARLWESFYPVAGLDQERRQLLARLEAGIPAFVALFLAHHPPVLRGRSLIQVMETERRQPARLLLLYQRWRAARGQMYRAPPSLVFAVLGQAKADGRITPEEESDLLAKLLTHWVLRNTLDTAAICAALPRMRVGAPVT